jgi:hypothetical protein
MATDQKQTQPLPATLCNRIAARAENLELPEQIVRLLLLGLAMAYAYILIH